MKDKRPDALLFPADHGGNLATSTLNRHWHKAREAAGRPDLRWHDLRHTGAVLAAQTGATLAELMGRLGHSTPQAALRYQHAAQGARRRDSSPPVRARDGQRHDDVTRPRRPLLRSETFPLLHSGLWRIRIRAPSQPYGLGRRGHAVGTRRARGGHYLSEAVRPVFAADVRNCAWQML
jgi:hypothetical protein